MNIEWEAGTYAEKFSFVPEYGEALLGLLDSPRDAPVIDLGCGDGALTAKIAGKGYEVIGVDASPAMLERARGRCPGARFILADALDYSAHGAAGAVFSNAVFHWIDEKDQGRLLANIAGSLRPGGQLVCEFGGKGNAGTVHAALERSFGKRGLACPRTFFFPDMIDYAWMLADAGLVAAFAVLFPRRTKVTSVEDWIRMFVKAPFAGMAEGLKDEIIAEAQEACRPALFDAEGWHVDYVRLRIKAVKRLDRAPGEGSSPESAGGPDRLLQEKT